MDDIGRCVWGTILSLILMLIAIFFSASKAALDLFSENKLKQLAEEGDKKAAVLCRWKEKQSDFSVRFDIYAMLFRLFAVGTAMLVWAPVVGRLFSTWAKETRTGLYVGAAVCVFLIGALIVLAFEQTLPKKLVSRDPEAFAFFAVGPCRLLDGLLRPLACLFPIWLFGLDSDKETADITEEEIRMLVDAGNENGTIEFSEREMINNIFEFDDRTVGEVMTHRTDLAAVSKKDSLSEVIRIATEQGFSRIPVYGEDIDDIIGIVYAKDLLGLVGDPAVCEKTIADYIRPTIYVPESARCRMLFKKFKEDKVHMAVVVDEYGGTAGIATMEDLLESIVGNIQDEYDREPEEIQLLESDSYSLDGGVSVEEVEELFDIELDADEDTDTVGGLVVNALGRIPQDGETVTVVIQNLEFTALAVEDRRIERVCVRRLPEITLEEE